MVVNAAGASAAAASRRCIYRLHSLMDAPAPRLPGDCACTLLPQMGEINRRLAAAEARAMDAVGAARSEVEAEAAAAGAETAAAGAEAMKALRRRVEVAEAAADRLRAALSEDAQEQEARMEVEVR